MTSSPLAEPATLASWLGLTFDQGSVEEERAGTVIGIISGRARTEARRPDWDLSNVPEDVSGIVLMAAVRAFTNPDGKSSVTMDDITRRWERQGMFDDDELRTLRKYSPGSSGGLSSIQFTTPSMMRAQAVSVDVEGGEPVRMYDGRGY